jgi:hypothetical protein
MAAVPGATSRRPFGVGLLALLIIIGGAFDVLGGILFLAEREDNEFLIDVDLSTNQITSWGVGVIILGVIAIFVGALLWRGSQFARYLVAVIAIIRLASVVFAVIRWDSIHWYSAIVPTVIYFIVAWYLLSSRSAQEFFDNRVA